MRYNKRPKFFNDNRKRTEGEEGIGPNRKYFRDDNRRRAQEIVSPDSSSLFGKFQSSRNSKFKRAEDFTREEKSAILARVRAVGIAQTAFEAGIRKRIIVKWLDEIDRASAQKFKPKLPPVNIVQKKPESEIKTSVEPETINQETIEMQQQNVEIKIENPTAPATEKIETEVIIEAKPLNENETSEEKIQTPVQEEHKEIKQPLIQIQYLNKNKNKNKIRHISPIEFENAILKSKIANVEDEIKFLRSEIVKRANI